MLLDNVHNGLHLLMGQHHTGGVAGVGHHDAAGMLVDQRLNAGLVRIAVALLRGGRNGPDGTAGHVGEGIVVGVERLRHQQLVAVVQNGGQHEFQRFTGAGGHQNVAPVQLDADLCVIAADGIQIFRQARRGGIFQHRILEVPNRFKERVRCFDIRLADIQMINGTALGLCLRRAGIELAHRGQLAFLNLTGKFHGNTPPSK